MDKINWLDPTALVSRHFSVGEVTQGDDRRIPDDRAIERNILRLAEELDQIRDAHGGPIGVTSWYRPPEINAEVGGAIRSQHLWGSAVDIYPIEGDAVRFEHWLDQNWGGGLGFGQRGGLGFTHLDLRGGGWWWGQGAIRWDY
jgi:uncharacterized protein YcbK (DUF882 family)